MDPTIVMARANTGGFGGNRLGFWCDLKCAAFGTACLILCEGASAGWATVLCLVTCAAQEADCAKSCGSGLHRF